MGFYSTFDMLIRNVRSTRPSLRTLKDLFTSSFTQEKFSVTKFVQKIYELPQSKICTAAELPLLMYIQSIYTHTHTHTHIYICVCVCAQLREFYIHKK